MMARQDTTGAKKFEYECLNKIALKRIRLQCDKDGWQKELEEKINTAGEVETDSIFATVIRRAAHKFKQEVERLKAQEKRRK